MYDELFLEDKINIADHIIKEFYIYRTINSINNALLRLGKNPKEKQELEKRLHNKYIGFNVIIADLLNNYKFGICFLIEYKNFIQTYCSENTKNLYNQKFEELTQIGLDKHTQEQKMKIFAQNETVNTLEYFSEYNGNNINALKTKQKLMEISMFRYPKLFNTLFLHMAY